MIIMTQMSNMTKMWKIPSRMPTTKIWNDEPAITNYKYSELNR